MKKQKACRHCGEKPKSHSNYCSAKCRFMKIAAPFNGADSCWEWPASRNIQTGYGQFRGDITTVGAHRMSWETFKGPIPDGLWVLHTCDNRGCFNPSHLFLGTQTDNMRDMHNKGRGNCTGPKIHWTIAHPELIKRGPEHHLVKHGAACLPRGERHSLSKLTVDKVIELRSSDKPLIYFAKKFNVSQSTLSSARRGETWAHVQSNLSAMSDMSGLK